MITTMTLRTIYDRLNHQKIATFTYKNIWKLVIDNVCLINIVSMSWQRANVIFNCQNDLFDPVNQNGQKLYLPPSFQDIICQQFCLYKTSYKSASKCDMYP
jgi:hypothetical protein